MQPGRLFPAKTEQRAPAKGAAKGASLGKGGGEVSNRQLKDRTLKALKEELEKFAPRSSPQMIQEWIDSRFKQDEMKQAMGQLVRDVCRNCLISGRGVQEHTFRVCRDLGNKCVLPCSRCVQAGRIHEIYHWVQDCEHSRDGN